MNPIQFFNHGNKDNLLIVDFNFPDKSKWKIERNFSDVEVEDFPVSLGGGTGNVRLERHKLIGDKLYLWFDYPIFLMSFDTHTSDQFTIRCELEDPTEEERQTFVNMEEAFGKRPHIEGKSISIETNLDDYPNIIKHFIFFDFGDEPISSVIKNRTLKYIYN